MPQKYAPKQEQALMSELWDPQIADDLDKFVLFAYPWGKENTPLHDQKGPRSWQRDKLQAMTEHIKAQKNLKQIGLDPEMFRDATVSGRGSGKSALVAWLKDWMMTTRLGSSTVITANTEPQLKTKTFAECNKWTTLLINQHWFKRSVLTIEPDDWFKELLAQQLSIDSTYYYTKGLLWSEENPDAFAGAHNMYGMLLIFDEASGIPNKIYDVSEGFFTDLTLDRYWFQFSNGRRNVGGFYDSFHVNKEFWRTQHLDSRTVEGVDHKRYDSIIKQYGIDSDVARVEVLGQFPKQGAKQFISNDQVHQAQARKLPDPEDLGAPLMVGLDVARFGNDCSIARFRRGRDARSIPAKKFKGLDNMQLANEMAHLIDTYHPDAVCIDAGQGTGVIDRLKEMGYGKLIHEIWMGAKAFEPQWANRRTELYSDCRDWLRGGCIDSDNDLFTDLTAPEYGFFGKAKDQIMLQSKEEIKDLIGRSPDDGDALVLTFGVKVARRDRNSMRGGKFDKDPGFRGNVARDADYSVLS